MIPLFPDLNYTGPFVEYVHYEGYNQDDSIQVVKMWGVWASLVSLLVVQNCSSYMYLLQHFLFNIMCS